MISHRGWHIVGILEENVECPNTGPFTGEAQGNLAEGLGLWMVLWPRAHRPAARSAAQAVAGLYLWWAVGSLMTVIIVTAAPIRRCLLYCRHVMSITRQIGITSLLSRCHYQPIL